MKRGLMISILTLMLQAPAYGEPSSGFVLQDILDKFRDGYQALLQGNNDTRDQFVPGSANFDAITTTTYSRYSSSGTFRSKDYVAYEYVTNGVLMDIKVVPKRNRRGLAASLAGNNRPGRKAEGNRGGIFGRPYYLTPADGSPHYSDLQNADRLYPQWVIKDF